ncbi:peptide-methionine (S)-S-oxide reductase MsrA [Sphingomonas sp.]|uniref:peptide-methionine (S)-S-oxide reductase MsrA n=1 Tax=Sphingomonas sp. TaxID=28214 RepID=UPI00286CF683|nr:peptide-methionine (S)-S-oxide reductase MsrA [Sphingomonas sp.]
MTMTKPILLPVAIVGGLLALAGTAGVTATVMAPKPLVDVPATSHREVAVFAGGCFWGVEGVYEHVRGVIDATSGYSGGSAVTAHYEMTGSGTTGHAEAVRVTFDPTRISYGELLRIYFSVVADPTLKDRQGPDTGPQYRSALFPTSPAQAKVARSYIAQLDKAKLFARPIVTTVEAYKGFYPAEAYHQNFMARNPTYGYIVINDRPKVEALKKQFPSAWRA